MVAGMRLRLQEPVAHDEYGINLQQWTNVRCLTWPFGLSGK